MKPYILIHHKHKKTKNQKPKTKQKTTAAAEAAQGIILPIPLSNLNNRMSPKTEISPNLKSNKI